MKVEINNENKAKFFALYWGQSVLYEPFIGQCVYVNQHIPMFMGWNKLSEGTLQLKPLSQISDEDKEHAFWVSPYDVNVSHYVYNVDYLRSKGYALPWMGLSVEEMIEASWIKLIES